MWIYIKRNIISKNILLYISNNISICTRVRSEEVLQVCVSVCVNSINVGYDVRGEHVVMKRTNTNNICNEITATCLQTDT